MAPGDLPPVVGHPHLWNYVGISLLQAAVRAHCSARIYGWRFAAASPLRIFWGNVLNCVATVTALSQFLGACMDHRTLAWHKTEHAYPAHRTPELEGPGWVRF